MERGRRFISHYQFKIKDKSKESCWLLVAGSEQGNKKQAISNKQQDLILTNNDISWKTLMQLKF